MHTGKLERQAGGFSVAGKGRDTRTLCLASLNNRKKKKDMRTTYLKEEETLLNHLLWSPERRNGKRKELLWRLLGSPNEQGEGGCEVVPA